MVESSDWPWLKLAMAGEAKTICKTLWGEVDLSARRSQETIAWPQYQTSWLQWQCEC